MSDVPGTFGVAIFCPKCEPELIPDWVGRDAPIGPHHFGIQFPGHKLLTVYLDGEKHTRTTECLAGEQGVIYGAELDAPICERHLCWRSLVVYGNVRVERVKQLV